MNSENYFEYLFKMKGDNESIDEEKKRIENNIISISSWIKDSITERTASNLIWQLTLKEIERLQPLVGIPISNFGSQARFLRALCATKQFDDTHYEDDPLIDQLLEYCDNLWSMLFFREMINDLRSNNFDTHDRRKRQMACMMSVMDAVQMEGAYIEQCEKRILNIFGPFSSEIIEPNLGLTVDEIIIGFRFVREEIPRRMARAKELMEPMLNEWRKFSQLADTDARKYIESNKNLNPRMRRIRSSYSAGCIIGTSLLTFTSNDFKKFLGDRSHNFLKVFSFIPGSINNNLITPFDDDEVRARPFAKLKDDRFLLHDLYYCSFAPLYRLIECFRNQRQTERLLQNRDKILEAESKRIISSMVGQGLLISNYYIPLGGNNSLSERDLLFYRDGILIIGECKAKPLRPISKHRGNVQKLESDVRSSIQSAYNQACSVLNHISLSTGEIVFFDSNKCSRKEIGRLNVNDIRQSYIIIILDSNYGLIATDLEPWLSKEKNIGYPWVVDYYTLESIANSIDSIEKLTSFLNWRIHLHGKVLNEDENVFAGFFLKHGPHDFSNQETIGFLDPNYSDIIESEYFVRNGYPVEFAKSELTDPVNISIRKQGNKIIQELDGKEINSLDVSYTHNTYTYCHSFIDKKDTHPVNEDRPISKAKSMLRVGRNSLCPCGSGKKYKKCCIRRI